MLAQRVDSSEPLTARATQSNPEPKTHHLRRVSEIGRWQSKRLADAYRRITHHSHQFGALVLETKQPDDEANNTEN